MNQNLSLNIFPIYGNNLVMKNRKIKTLSIILFLFVCLLVPLLTSCDSMANQKELANQCLRIHIRANSNSQCDQAVKLKVRDKLTVFFEDLLVDCTSKQEAVNKIENAIGQIQKIANETLKENDFDYVSQAKITNEHFPERNYGDYIFQEGNYDALIVELGSANGDNWWCVAFPPLCFVPNGMEEKIIYKSWVKEMLDKIFS